MARLIRDVARGSETLVELLDLTLLNMVVGNADAHARKFSLLHLESDVVVLAHAYDIMSPGYHPIASAAWNVRERQAFNPGGVRPDVIAEAISWGMSRDRGTAKVESCWPDFPMRSKPLLKTCQNFPGTCWPT